MIAYPQKKYNLEASLSTLAIVLLLFLLVWFIRLSVPDPPLEERGGGPEGKGKMMTLAFAPTASENPSSRPSTAPEPQEQEPQEETPEETPSEPEPEPVTDNNVISDNTSTDEIKASPTKKKHTEDAPKKKTEESDKPVKEKSTKKKVNAGDLFEGDDEGTGGDPNGNSDKGIGSPGSGGGTSSGHSFGENGWNWSKAPKTDKTSKKNGEIVFSVEIDENGKVSNVIPKRYTVDYELMQSYQEECYKLKFVRKNDIAMSGSTKGTITFSFKAR